MGPRTQVIVPAHRVLQFCCHPMSSKSVYIGTMTRSNDSLDKLIEKTLSRNHSHAFHEGLTLAPRSLSSIHNRSTITYQKIPRQRNRSRSLVALAASFLVFAGFALPIVLSSQEGTRNEPTRVRAGSKVTTTVNSLTDNDNGDNTPTTSNPISFDNNNIPATTAKNLITPSTTPFSTTPSPPPTAPVVVNQLARVSYSNNRANDVPLDGATISGNVYIFISNTDVYSALWFLDDGGAFEKGTHFRGGKTLPIDFNYRESDRLTPKPFDTSQWSVGQHSLGIQTKSISTGKYSHTSITFYVTR